MKVLAYLLLIPSAVGNTILRGWTLSVLWAWFVVSQFPGMPHLGIVTASGLALTIAIFRAPNLTDKETVALMSEEQTTVDIKGRWIQQCVMAGVSLIALFSGWIWHHFM